VLKNPGLAALSRVTLNDRKQVGGIQRYGMEVFLRLISFPK
jgi:hypothetical protein